MVYSGFWSVGDDIFINLLQPSKVGITQMNFILQNQHILKIGSGRRLEGLWFIRESGEP